MHIRTIRPQEIAAVRALCFSAFEANIDFTSSPQASAEQILHAPLTRMQQQYLNTFAAFDEQENPIATVAQCTPRARFDGGILQMEAIGDVATLPQAQGTGAVRKMFAEQRDMRIAAELVPRCPRCGRPMTMNLRCDDTFVQGAGW